MTREIGITAKLKCFILKGKNYGFGFKENTNITAETPECNVPRHCIKKVKNVIPIKPNNSILHRRKDRTKWKKIESS